ncbi:patatin-like phospholipase protein [Ceratobasidium sp. AG-Ba]|nr:patatin-like phospholipase protein [Ceratobasidium sp. AG-Ba]QRW02519.1 patatin-like phospholipase protein [Ceratobasidium sp. AG-Ba]
MSVTEAIQAYGSLARDIFGETKLPWQEGTFKAANLEKAIKIIVGKYDPSLRAHRSPELVSNEDAERDGARVLMANPAISNNRGRVFVCSLAAENPNFVTRFRTYEGRAHNIPNCGIWEAARATSAAPKFFKPIRIPNTQNGVRYMDGGLRVNNPIHELLAEMVQYFPYTSRVSCILSIGTGERPVIRVPKAGIFPKLQLLKFVSLLKDLALDCQAEHQHVAPRFRGRNTYFRLNVDSGLENIDLAEWENLEAVTVNTRSYMQKDAVDLEIDRVVIAIMERGYNQHLKMTVHQAAGQ